MSEPKRPDADSFPVPPVDEKANRAFLDEITDTDGRPNDEAVDIVETEGFEDEDDR